MTVAQTIQPPATAWRRTARALAVMSLVAGLAAPTTAEARKKTKAQEAQHRLELVEQKVDKALRRELTRANPQRVRVIVRTKRGRRAALREQLRGRGDAVSREHASIESLTAEVQADSIEELAQDPSIESVSIDAIVRVEGQQAGRGRNRQSRRTPRRTAPTAGQPIGTAAGTAEDGRDWDDDVDLHARVRGEQPRISQQMKDLRKTLGVSGKGWKTSGKGVGVAVIDTGVAQSLDLTGRISAFHDFTQGGIATAPYDDHGHGSHVAGLIGANTFKGRSGYRGVAPAVHVIGLKVLDASGSGYTSDVIAAIEFAAAYKERLGIDIINLSLGHPIFEAAATDPLVQAVEAAVRAGIVVVASAGNYGTHPETGEAGYAGVTSPGNAASALTVGALDTRGTVNRRDDRVPTYSSRGPSWYDGYAKPDLVAPGDELISDVGSKASELLQAHRQFYVPGVNGYYYMALSGTSMAAGVASGVVAQVLEANRTANRKGPALTPNAVKAILQFTAVPVMDDTGLPYDALTQGAGGINGAGAVALARAIDNGAPVGSSWLSTAVDPYTKIDRQTYAWAQHVVWGEHIVWGDAVYQNVQAWARNVVWGDARNIVWGNAYNIVWGNAVNIVWGNAVNVVWGNHIVWGNAFNVVWGNARHIVWGNLADPSLGTANRTTSLAATGVF